MAQIRKVEKQVAGRLEGEVIVEEDGDTDGKPQCDFFYQHARNICVRRYFERRDYTTIYVQAKSIFFRMDTFILTFSTPPHE